jgi:hypothetical protein
MEVDDFQSRTDAFLSWLSAAGIRMSPKMQLRDLRSESRGRGVGTSSSFELVHLSALITPDLSAVELHYFLSVYSSSEFPQLTGYCPSGHGRFRRGRGYFQYSTLCSFEHYNNSAYYCSCQFPTTYWLDAKLAGKLAPEFMVFQ